MRTLLYVSNTAMNSLMDSKIVLVDSVGHMIEKALVVQPMVSEQNLLWNSIPSPQPISWLDLVCILWLQGAASLRDGRREGWAKTAEGREQLANSMTDITVAFWGIRMKGQTGRCTCRTAWYAGKWLNAEDHALKHLYNFWCRIH